MKVFSFSIFVLLITLLFPGRVLSADIFDFAVSKDLSVHFTYKLPPDLVGHAFRVRPVSNKNLTLWNKALNSWVGIKSLWSLMPPLSNELKLKTTEQNFGIYFLLQDLKTSLTYKTPIHKVWSKTQFDDYIKRLNNSIVGWGVSTPKDGKIP